MAQLKMEAPHKLGKDEAAARLKQQLDKRRDEFQQHVKNLETNWSGEELAFSFSAVGFQVGGTLAVDDDRVQVNAQIPLPALMFKGKIEEMFQQQMGLLLT